MDQLINAGKQFLNSQGGEGQQQQQSNQQQQGQQHQGQQQQGGSGGGFDIGSISDLVGHAQNHDQSNSGNQQLFGQVASFLQSQQGNVNGNINENQLMQSHDKVNNSHDNVSSGEIGNAAALSAIKSVLGGGGGAASSGGSFQQKLIGAAMAHAGQLFDQKSDAGQASGDKQDAMQQAGQAVMKLLVKNQVSGMIGGGNSGGLSSLMKLVG